MLPLPNGSLNMYVRMKTNMHQDSVLAQYLSTLKKIKRIKGMLSNFADDVKLAGDGKDC